MDQDNDKSDFKPDKIKIAEICPGIWIGGLSAIAELCKIPRRWTVISVLKSPKLSDFIKKSIAEINNKNGNNHVVQEHMEWELADQSQACLLGPKLEEVLSKMDESIQQKRVVEESKEDSTTISSQLSYACLVHCAFGISRSATVCAAWLLSRQKATTLAGALTMVRAARPEAAPNMGFLAALRAIEQCNGSVCDAIQRMDRRQKNATRDKQILQEDR